MPADRSRSAALSLPAPQARIRDPQLLATITLIGTIGIAASTIYVSSVPAIGRDLAVAPSAVQLTFSCYLAAFAASTLIVGELSDRIGRRRTLVAGLLCMLVGSLGGALSSSIEALICARIIQGIGGCVGMVVSRALVRDRFGRDAAARVLAGLSFAMTLAQALAPILGAYLQQTASWRMSFAVIAALAALAIGLSFRYVTALPSPKQAKAPSPIEAYRTLIQARGFLGYALAAAGASAGFALFSSGGSSVMIGSFGLSPQTFALYATLPPAGFLIGATLSRRLGPKLGIEGVMMVGALVLLSAAGVMIGLTSLHVTLAVAVILPMAAVCCGSGLLTPQAIAGALDVRPDIAGAASGLATFVQLVVAACATGALSSLDSHSALALAALVMVVAVLAAAAVAFGTPQGTAFWRNLKVHWRQANDHIGFEPYRAATGLPDDGSGRS